MKSFFLSLASLFFISISIYAQEETNQLYSNSNIFTDIKGYTDTPENYTSFNIGYEFVTPLKIGGELHSNIKHGYEFNFGGLLQSGDGLALGSDIMTLRASYVIGYELPVSNQLSFFASVKPGLDAVLIFTEDPNSNSGEEDITTDYSFSGLIGLEGRYFFSEKGKFGLSAEMLTSFEGGFGFLVGFAWRNIL